MSIHKFEPRQGLITFDLDGQQVLLDTGSPQSLAREPFLFLDEERNLADRFPMINIGLDSLSEMAGFPIDIFLGGDLLSETAMRINWERSEVEFGDDLLDEDDGDELIALMGIPVTGMLLDDSETRAFVDTGAHVSYTQPEFVQGRKVARTIEDFYPTVGHFSTDVYVLPVEIQGHELDLEFGVLPDALQGMMSMLMAMSGVGTVVGTGVLEHLECAISWPRERILWRAI